MSGRYTPDSRGFARRVSYVLDESGAARRSAAATFSGGPGDIPIRTAGTWAICLFVLLAASVAGYAYLNQEDAIAVVLLGAALAGVGALFITDRI